MPSPHEVFCESPHKAFVESAHGVRGCGGYYELIVGTTTHYYGQPNLVVTADQLATWRNVWKFNRKMEFLGSTITHPTFGGACIEAEAIQGGDFFPDNAYRMTFENPRVVKWASPTATSSIYAKGVSLSAKRGLHYQRRAIPTTPSVHLRELDINNGSILNLKTNSNIYGTSNSSLGTKPAAILVEPYGVAIIGLKFFGTFPNYTAEQSLLVFDEGLTLRRQQPLPGGDTLQVYDLVADESGITLGATVQIGFVNYTLIQRFDHNGNMLWSWGGESPYTGPPYIGSNAGVVVLSALKFGEDVTSRLVKLDAATGVLLDDKPLGNSIDSTLGVGGLAVGPDGKVFVTGRGLSGSSTPGAIRWFDANLDFQGYALEFGAAANVQGMDVRIVQKI